MGLLFTFKRTATEIRADRRKVVEGLLDFVRHYDLFRQYEASSLGSGVKTIEQHLDHCEWLKQILSAELDQLLATEEYKRFCEDRDDDWEAFEESLAREVAPPPAPPPPPRRSRWSFWSCPTWHNAPTIND